MNMFCFERNEAPFLEIPMYDGLMFNGDATEHIGSYSEDFIGNGETVYIDYVHDCIWLADDWESSVMYRMDFTK